MAERAGSRVVLRDGLLVVLSLLVGLVIAELAVRALHLAPGIARLRFDDPHSAYERVDNPVMGYAMKKNYRDPQPNLHESLPSTNAHGQRDVERTYERRPGVRRLLLLGDSVVAGHGIRELDDTISRQLERRMGEGVEVLNFGIGGYCTRGEAELLRVEGVKYHPDEVVVVFVANDYENLNGQVGGYAFARPPWSEEAFVHSRLFRVLSLRLDWFHFREVMGPAEYRASLNASAIAGDRSERGANVDEGFRIMRALADEQGFEISVVLWPVFGAQTIGEPGVDPDERPPLLVERYAEKHRLPLLHLADGFRRARVANPRDVYTIGDGMHPSPAGAKRAAELIQEWLMTRSGRAGGPWSGEGRAGR